MDTQIVPILDNQILSIEDYLKADLFCFYSEIQFDMFMLFREQIESLKSNSKRKRIAIMIQTIGGSVEFVKKMVDIIRYHYQEVYFVIPNYAMSAGTVLCMSGDKIYMDYSSSLSPTDPHFYKNGNSLSALGFLDKFNELSEKSTKTALSHAETMLVQQLDLATLRRCELATEHCVFLIENLLNTYLLKSHLEKDKEKQLEKMQRAKDVATTLNDNRYWKTHDFSIGIDTLKNGFCIPVEDYSTNKDLQKLIRECNKTICDFLSNHKDKPFLYVINNHNEDKDNG